MAKARKHDKDTLSHSFVSGELHLGFWSFVKKLFGFADSFFILRSLSVYQFGVYQLLLAFYAFFSDIFHDVFSNVISNDLSRFIGDGKMAEAKRLFAEYSLFRLITGAIPAIAGFFLAPLLSENYGPEAILWIRLLSGLFFVDAALNTILSLLKVQLHFKLVAARPTIQKFIQFLTLGYFYFFATLTIREVFIAQLIAPALTIFLVLPSFWRTLRPLRKVRAARTGIFWGIAQSYGVWEVPQLFTRNLVGKVRPLLIKIFISTEAVGLFGVAAMAIAMLKDVIPARTLNMVLPRKANDPQRLHLISKYGTKYYVLLSLVLVLGGIFAYSVGIGYLFPQFESSIIIFFLLLPTIPLFAFIKITNILLVVARHQRFIFLQAVLTQSLGIVFILFFAPLLGIIGLSIAEVAALGISVFVKYSYLTKIKFMRPFKWGEFFVFDSTDRAILGQFKYVLRDTPFLGRLVRK